MSSGAEILPLSPEKSDSASELKPCAITLGGAPGSAGVMKPPLVSFLLINWNYGRFVGQAIDSIRNQDYSFFECLVVDNGSTDDSRDVIAQSIRNDKRFAVEFLDQNYGQLGAAMRLLDRLRGDFVAIVDADDVLFPGFASFHIQVHLALASNVGFTSSAAIQIGADGQALAPSRFPLFKPAASPGPSSLKPADIVPRLSIVSDQDYVRLGERTVPIPHSADSWGWGGGTSNVYRRSVLELARIDTGGRELFFAADAHFNRFCNLLTGSIAIHIPLSAYRIHGANYHSLRESFSTLRMGHASFWKNRNEFVRVSLQPLLRDAEKFAWLLGRVRYWHALDRLTRIMGKVSPSFYRDRETEALFAANLRNLSAAFGRLQLIRQLLKRFSPMAVLRILFHHQQ